MPKQNTILLELGKQTGEQVLEQLETAKAAEVVLTIRSQHQLLCNGMPPDFQLRVELPPEAYGPWRRPAGLPVLTCALEHCHCPSCRQSALQGASWRPTVPGPTSTTQSPPRS